MWEYEELQSEQVRGLFAIGVMASIIAYLTYRSSLKIPATNVAATNLFAFIDLGSLILLSMWGIYVVTTGVSMTFFSAAKPLGIILRGFKRFGRFCYYLGSFSTLAFGLYYIPLFYFEAFQAMNLLNQVVFIAVIASGLSALVILWVYPRRRAKRGPQESHQPPS